MSRRAWFYVGSVVVIVGLPLLRWELELRQRHAHPIALCPKIEYRVLPSKNRRTIRIDTVTIIPEGCR